MSHIVPAEEPRSFDLRSVSDLADAPVERLVYLGKLAIEQAGSFNEVRDIRAKADALQAFLRARGASLEAINVAAQLRIRAERRMGEMLGGMEKAKGGWPSCGDSVSPQDRPATYSELGIDKKQASRLQAVAAVPSDMFEAVLTAHERQGAPPTKEGLLRTAKRAKQEGRTAVHVASTQLSTSRRRSQDEERFFEALDRASSSELLIQKYTGEYEWYTPPKIIEGARTVLGAIDLDPASSPIAQETVCAQNYFSRTEDGLTQPWNGRVYLNPPYAKDLIEPFVNKLVHHVIAGEVTAAVMLTDNRSDTRWFHHAADHAKCFCLTRGRLKFLRPDGESGAPINGSCLFYFGKAPERFTSVFQHFGMIAGRIASAIGSCLS